MHGRTSRVSAIQGPDEQIVRTYRIRIENVPALFSEGTEPEPIAPQGQPWLQSARARLARLFAKAALSMAPAQARDEKAVSPAAMRRQTQAQA
jgi:hypothetical protein